MKDYQLFHVAGKNFQYQRWCGGKNGQVLITDLNGDGKSDMVCVDLSRTYIYMAFANGNGHIQGTGWQGGFRRCIGVMYTGK